MSKRKLMIVDDEPSVLELFTEVFEDDESLEIMCCESGVIALEKFDGFLPDVILLDVMMPGKNGFEVCREIKTKAEGQKTKVIMVTGMAGSDVKVEAESAGCDSFYFKPINIRDLKSEIKSA